MFHFLSENIVNNYKYAIAFWGTVTLSTSTCYFWFCCLTVHNGVGVHTFFCISIGTYGIHMCMQLPVCFRQVWCKRRWYVSEYEVKVDGACTVIDLLLPCWSVHTRRSLSTVGLQPNRSSQSMGRVLLKMSYVRLHTSKGYAYICWLLSALL
jgi:hypothetical protein